MGAGNRCGETLIIRGTILSNIASYFCGRLRKLCELWRIPIPLNSAKMGDGTITGSTLTHVSFIGEPESDRLP